MKIIINNINNIINDAFHTISDTQFSLNLFINTKDKKRIYPDCRTTSIDQYQLDYYVKDSDIHYDSVIFKAEDELEKEMLSWINFELLCKDQLWIIFIKDMVYYSSHIKR